MGLGLTPILCLMRALSQLPRREGPPPDLAMTPVDPTASQGPEPHWGLARSSFLDRGEECPGAILEKVSL